MLSPPDPVLASVSHILLTYPLHERLLGRFLRCSGHSCASAATYPSVAKAICGERPELILSDWQEDRTLELIGWLRASEWLHLPLVIFTAVWQVRLQALALRAGADAWVAQPIEPALLVAMIEAQIAGCQRRKKPAAPPPPQLQGRLLTRAEARVLALVVQGKSNKEIAAALGVSTRTVDSHVTALLGKGEVSKRTELVRLVLCSTPSA